MTIRDYSTTAANNNSAPPNGWPEGMAPSGVNDCGRQMMAEIRESFEELPYFDYGDDPTRVDNDTFTVAGDLTARYPVGARVKLVGATTGTGRITVSSHAAGTTTIDVVMDSGNVPLTLTRVAVAPAPVAASTASPAAVTLTASAGTSGGVSRDDHVHALSQSIAPTMTAAWTFSLAYTGVGAGTPVTLSSAAPVLAWNETDAAANNRLWQMFAGAEGFQFRVITDDGTTTANTIFSVERTGATVDRVAFPTEASGALSVGTLGTIFNSARMHVRTTTASAGAAQFINATAATSTVYVHNEATAGDNVFVTFQTEAGAGGTTRGTIDFNRAGTAVRYNTTSDGRLKRNVRASESALPVVLSLPVEAFDWIEGDVHVEHGFVAQKLYQVYPDAVSGGDREDGIMGIDRGALVPVLTKALQETISELMSLTSRVAALERAGSLPK